MEYEENSLFTRSWCLVNEKLDRQPTHGLLAYIDV